MVFFLIVTRGIGGTFASSKARNLLIIDSIPG